MSEWQPIETAPKDGTRMIFFAPGNKSRGEDYIDRQIVMKVDRWNENAWWQMRPRNPYTHWMPLPLPPVTP